MEFGVWKYMYSSLQYRATGQLHASEIDTSYIVNEYQKIQTLFSWMGIDSRSMLYGLDHVQSVCSKINALK